MTVRVLTPWRNRDSYNQFLSIVEFLNDNISPRIDLPGDRDRVATSAYDIDRETCKKFWIVRRRFNHCEVWTIPAEYETLLAMKYGLWTE